MFRFDDAANYERIRQINLLRAKPNSKRPKISFNRWYGNCFVKRFEKEQNRYQAKCRCGALMLLTEKEMLAKQYSKTGCRSMSCTAETVEQKLAADFFMVLKYQHFILLTVCPELVCSWWGGTADDGLKTSWQVGADRFAQYVYNSDLPLLQPAPNFSFISRINKELPYIEGNLKFSDLPEQKVRRTIGRVKVSVHGTKTDATLTQYKALLNTPDLDLTVKAFKEARYTPGLFNL